MENKTMITLLYELAKTKYKNKSFTFLQVWEDLIKKCKLNKDEQKKAGLLYVNMLQDKRFIFVGDKKWQIREFLDQKSQDKLSQKLFDLKYDVQEENTSNVVQSNDDINTSNEDEQYDTTDNVE